MLYAGFYYSADNSSNKCYCRRHTGSKSDASPADWASGDSVTKSRHAGWDYV